MQRLPSPEFQTFLFHAELAHMQVARLNRVARDFQLLVQSAALFLEHAARDARREGASVSLRSEVRGWVLHGGGWSRVDEKHVYQLRNIGSHYGTEQEYNRP